MFFCCAFDCFFFIYISYIEKSRPPKKPKQKTPALSLPFGPTPNNVIEPDELIVAPVTLEQAKLDLKKAKAADLLGDVANLQVKFNVLYDGGNCSCTVCAQLTVSVLRELAKSREVSILAPGATTTKQKLSKSLLILSLCCYCTIVPDGSDDERNDGYAAKFKRPILTQGVLTICDAFHLHVVGKIAALPVETPGLKHITVETNCFRVHILSHLVDNSNYILRSRKINNIGTSGFKLAPNSAVGNATLITSFVEGCAGFISHYNDDHEEQFCGRLRVNKQCTPFQVWSKCLPLVKGIIETAVALVSSFVEVEEAQMFRNGFNTVSHALNTAHPDQVTLRKHFHLPAWEGLAVDVDF